MEKKKVFTILLVLLSLGLVAACSNSVSEYADESGIAQDIESSSSSAGIESSSEQPIEVVPPCKTDTEDNCEYGTVVDERDGQVYKTVKIGDQWWTAENLAYWYGTPYKACCVGGEDCYKPGINYDAPSNAVCPSGWHLPSVHEYETLFATVGGDSIAGLVLRDRKTNWYDSLVGTDAYGFTAVHSVLDLSAKVKGLLCFATSTEDTMEVAAGNQRYYYYVCLNDTTTEIHRYWPDEDYDYGYNRHSYPVRCVKDDTTAPNRDVSRIYVADLSRLTPGSYMCRDYLIPKICKQNGEDNCEYGTLTDNRDGKVYKTVKIGYSWWMAENLNYAYLQSTDSLDSSSFCYKDSAEYCEKYGRLYLWSAAMDSVGMYSANGKGCGSGAGCTPTFPVRGVCPEGWHIPNSSESGRLRYQYSNAREMYDVEDAYGLNMVSTGLLVSNRWTSLSAEDSIPIGMFWTSSGTDGCPWVVYYLKQGIYVRKEFCRGNNAVSVRCVKD